VREDGSFTDVVKNFLEAGGSLLVATDRPMLDGWTGLFAVTVAGVYLQIHPASAGYGGSPDCPFVKVLPGNHLPIFEGLKEIATNKPSYLVLADQNPRGFRALAGFHDGCWTQTGGPLDQREAFFAVAKEWPSGGRVLVLADHSVFINAMMLGDNDNF